MTIVNLYKKLKQVLNESNSALIGQGFSEVDSLYQIPSEIKKHGEINCLPYLLRDELLEVAAEDLYGVTRIKNYAFYNCKSLTSITIPDSVTSIGDYAFYYCRSLTSITIPDGVTSINSFAFYNCTSLTSITIPDSVTSIGDYAFAHCTSLTSITIPKSVIYIGPEAFYGCTKLTDVYVKSTIPPTLHNTTNVFPTTTIIHVPIGSGNAYKSATNWSNCANRIVEDIVTE